MEISSYTYFNTYSYDCMIANVFFNSIFQKYSSTDQQIVILLAGNSRHDIYAIHIVLLIMMLIMAFALMNGWLHLFEQMPYPTVNDGAIHLVPFKLK